jgi:hypothetical protein
LQKPAPGSGVELALLFAAMASQCQKQMHSSTWMIMMNLRVRRAAQQWLTSLAGGGGGARAQGQRGVRAAMRPGASWQH